MRRRFLQYGSRSTPIASSTASSSGDAGKSHQLIAFHRSLDQLARVQVPHPWFIHFYLISVSASLFWASQYLTHGSAVTSLLRFDQSSRERSMSAKQIYLTWFLMLVQGLRRLYECMVFMKRSSSQMWVGHWVLGIVFYLSMSMAVWSEGGGKKVVLFISGSVLMYLQLFSRLRARIGVFGEFEHRV